MSAAAELSIFVPIAKIDEEKRLVYGTLTEEVVDKAGEVFDYASSKPYFEKWTGEFAKATNGASVGNLRVMHGTKVAGKLTEVDFDDVAKRVSIVAKVVDDVEWKMCLEGAYTGFSQGGRYVRRWTDDAGLKRYTANPSEASLVDNPCLGTAHFELIKVDGMTEQREFRAAAPYSPSNEEVKAKAEALAKAAGKTGKANDFIVKARERLIAERAEADAEAEASEPAETLEKVADEPGLEANAEPVVAAEEPAVEDPAEKVDLAEALTAAVEKASTAAAEPVVTAPPAQVTPGLADFAKGLAELATVPAIAEHPLAKGLYTVAALARLLDQLAGIQASSAWEAEHEGDNSALPAELAASVQALGANLVAMASEEVAELIQDMKDGDGETIVIIDDSFAYAASVVDLVKADADLMEKAGARHSKKDMAAIQSMHDTAAGLGAKCAGTEKAAGEGDDLAKMAAENAKLSDAVEKALPAIETLTKGLEEARTENADLKKRLEVVENTPAAPRVAGSLHAVSKAEDVNPASAPSRLTPEQVAAELAKLSDHDRAMLLTKAALRLPVAS